MANLLEQLAACAGTWTGTNRLHNPMTNQPEDTPSTVTVTPMLGGRFVRMEYTWSYQGRPQEGMMLVGCEAKAGEVTAQWIDSWHMGDMVMACRGTAGADGTISVRGHYAAGDGPDWGWDSRIAFSGAADSVDTLRITMYNVSPDGEAMPAVEASYTRG